MVRCVLSALPLALLFFSVTARAAEYYVAPGGSGNTCSMAAPCALPQNVTMAAAGDTVWIRGGNYTFAASATVGFLFSRSGAANNPIKYFAYMNEAPVVDLSNGTPSGRVTGLSITGSYNHIRGLEVHGVQQYMSGQDSWGVRIQGSNNTLERIVSHHNEAPGFFITSGGNNLILNCDSHHNYDQAEGGGSGDGFGCHSSTGGNVLRGCRAYNNSDDGYDFINAPGVCTVEQSWSWSNGYVPDTTTAAGNGAGFKAGGFGSPPTNVPNPVPRHVVRQCMAFRNRAQGFYANHHPGGLDFLNNIAFNNPTQFNMLTDTTSDHHLHNNIAIGTAISNMVGGTQTSNSWTLSVTVNDQDFMSVMESEAGSPRQADGSLPNIAFRHLVMGSDLIDKGENVGLPFSGPAPDLGPFEFGLTAGTGGMGGTGGSGMGGRAMGGAGGTGAGGMPGGAAGTAAGGVAGSSAGTSAGGAAGDGAGTGAGASAGVGTGGAGPTGGTGGATSGGAPVGGTGTSGTGTGATPTGGASTTGGNGGTGGDSSTAGGTAEEPAGCGCRLGGRPLTEGPASLAAIVALAAFFGRRRRSQRTH